MTDLQDISCPHCRKKITAAGADQATLQKLLGHANYSTTANIYHHADLAALKKAIDLLP